MKEKHGEQGPGDADRLVAFGVFVVSGTAVLRDWVSVSF